MPKTDHDTKQKRVELVYRLVERHPNGLSEQEIADALNIGRRSVNNYLRELEIAGRVYKDGQLWCILPYNQTRLRHFELTPEEAMTLYLATRLLVKQHDKRNESAETALVKLAEVLTGDVGVGKEIHQAALELAHRPGDESYSRIFRIIMQSYIYRRRVAITYRPMHSDAFQTVFSPYLLEPSAIGYATYVIGHSSIVDDLRTYKLERIEEASLTASAYDVPADFPGLDHLRSAWSIISGKAVIEVKLRFTPKVTPRVKESRWHPSQKIVGDPDRPGSCIWTARIADLTDFRPWVRGWGADVEVLAPDILREQLTRETQRLARLYAVRGSEPPSDTKLTRLLRCWGKSGSHPTDFHPAFFHMLDVGHVAEVLLQPPASSRWREALALVLGGDPQTLSVWLPYVVAMHDIGKLSAEFQSQRTDQHKRMKAEGFPFEKWPGDVKIHHSLIGQSVLKTPSSDLTVSDVLMQAWKDSIGGHHGYFHSRTHVRRTGKQLQNYEPLLWQEMREYAATALAKHFLPPTLYALPSPPELAPATMALAGFIILCDWIGSNQRYFSSASETDLQTYVAESRAKANRALKEAGFLQPTASETTTCFGGLFPDKKPPRPLQTAVDTIPKDELDSPCLAIIEAPTGEGKTEAALALAHRIARAQGTDELYYALPTTATSNQMYVRIQDHLRKRLDLPTEVKLIHGQAFLVEDDLRIEPWDNDDPSDRQAVVRWFTSKKRAILAPFGVGTVDQAELAALNTKHVALRLMGLAGKVVIFDEVHAYDTYMTTIIERLLNWLSRLGTSVILLSATLPQAQRTKLATAYGADGTSTTTCDDYPSLSIFHLDRKPYSAHPPAYQPARPLTLDTLHLDDDAPDEKAQWLLRAIEEGGCACWITNTVARAQQIFKALQIQAPDNVDISLLHARFPLAERQRREQRLTTKYGPSDVDRPARGIVVGTQVLEQSLDLDFDVMVTDLAPIDLLLQRAGRLQRHDRKRPDRHAEHATLWVNLPDQTNDLPDLGVDGAIYDPFILQQTWAVLCEKDVLRLPDAYRSLIEAVYGIDEVLPDNPLHESWSKQQNERSNDRKEAELRLIPEPDAGRAFASRIAELQFEEDETGASWIVAQTRLGRESINLIPLEKIGKRARLVSSQVEVDLDRPASRETQLHMLRYHLRVSRPEIVVELKRQQNLPKLFTHSARLKGYYPLWLTREGARFEKLNGEGTILVTLDPELGLVIEAEED